MREILFRGRQLDNGKWVHGWYDMYSFGLWPLKPSIVPSDKAVAGEYEHIEVNPATIGQYIGWTDCKGQKIFEGDIVRITLPIGGGRQIVQVSKVYFDNGCFCVNWGGDFRPRPRTSIDSFVPATIFEIIGNIYDNPELLE